MGEYGTKKIESKFQKPTKKAKYSQKDKKYCKKIVSVI